MKALKLFFFAILQLVILAPLGWAQSLGTTNLLEGPTAGSDSVVLAASNSWTASANDSWLHMSAVNQSGTCSANVIFSFDANSGATRTGTLTIAGQTLTVTQAGFTYLAANLAKTAHAGRGQETIWEIPDYIHRLPATARFPKSPFRRMEATMRGHPVILQERRHCERNWRTWWKAWPCAAANSSTQYPFTDPANIGIRRKFDLPADRPLNA